ncbi:hypothetical protein EW146_g2878 [Bondarzewia mesenterica]|uniref:DUF7918 domain-containing protein n=1 Tax=Bondarzewia mesenterica TaxID=1095465 RepID=A0A4S4LZC7_9AGAM|nr:hypothetical protein EW146_g2878 [Bondarzewia mesenterica]
MPSLELNGCSSSIICDESELEIYAQELIGMRTMSCYVPSESGKVFQVRVHNTIQSLAAFYVYMDGRLVAGRALHPGLSPFIIVGLIDTEHTIKPFQFSDLAFRDDDDNLDGGDVDLSKLGTIEIIVVRVESLGSVMEHVPTNVAQIGPVSELTKKTGWNCVSFGRSVPNFEILECYSPNFIDSMEAPWAKFCFRYQPKVLLQAKGIIPRTVSAESGISLPSPPPATGAKRVASAAGTDRQERQKTAGVGSGEEAGGSSHPEMQRAPAAVKAEPNEGTEANPASEDTAARIKALEAELVRLKRAHASSASCKVERPPSPIHLGTACGEVIDLTDD